MHHNINMFTTGNTHLKYRKHRVHSAAHKLKIRSSQLVLTTAGTDLDSTDRSAIGGAKNSSASEPLKRPILSLWNSRVLSINNKMTQATVTRESTEKGEWPVEDYWPMALWELWQNAGGSSEVVVFLVVFPQHVKRCHLVFGLTGSTLQVRLQVWRSNLTAQTCNLLWSTLNNHK